MGCKRTLEIMFLAWKLLVGKWVKGMEFQKSLPRFKEKDRVRIAQRPAWMIANGSG